MKVQGGIPVRSTPVVWLRALTLFVQVEVKYAGKPPISLASSLFLAPVARSIHR